MNMEPHEVEKQKKLLESTYNMYEDIMKATTRELKYAVNSDGTRKFDNETIEKKIGQLTQEQGDIVKQYTQLGGNPDDLKKKSKRKKTVTTDLNNYIDQYMLESYKREKGDKNMVKEEIINDNKEMKPEKIDVISNPDILPEKDEYKSDMAFDVIPLPSKGECYKNKNGRISVSFLNAYDENMIVSPNLYRDNLILDYLLKEKIVNKDIDPMDLIEGDRDAIILYLRSTGYGVEYPISATDPDTGIEFDTVVDLSKLKFKEFTLKGDENGWFDYTLPVSKSNVKFRFLTHRDIVNLERISEVENKKLMKNKISECVSVLDSFIENDDNMTNAEKVKVRNAIRTIERWEDSLSDDTLLYNHDMTNRLILSIMSIDGNTDRGYISDFVKRMCVKDSSSLRKYISKNEPGIDYQLTIEKPESLGGGSMSVFLQFDQFIFLNIT